MTALLALTLAALLAASGVPAGVQRAENFPGKDASEKIIACLAAAKQASGVCDARGLPAKTLQIISRTIDIPGPVELDLAGATRYHVTIRDGSDVFRIGDGAALVADHQRGDPATFTFAEDAVLGAFIANGRRDGEHAFLKVTGVVALGNSEMKLKRAAMELESVYFGTEVHHITLACFPGILMLLTNSPRYGLGPFALDQVELNGCGMPGARPLVLRSVAKGGLISGISVRNSGLEHAGPGQCQVEIDGAATAAAVMGVTFENNYSEASHPRSCGLRIRDAMAVQVNTWVFGTAGGDYVDAVTVEESEPGRSAGIVLRNIFCQTRCGAALRDAAHGIVMKERVPNYVSDEHPRLPARPSPQ